MFVVRRNSEHVETRRVSVEVLLALYIKSSLLHSQVSASVVSTGAAGGVVISPSPSPSCLSAASSIDNLTAPLSEITVGGATGPADGASGSDRKEGESTYKRTSCYLKSGAGSFACIGVTDADDVNMCNSWDSADVTVSLQLCST